MLYASMQKTKRQAMSATANAQANATQLEASEQARLKAMLNEAGIPQRHNVSADKALSIIQQGAAFFLALSLAANTRNANSH